MWGGIVFFLIGTAQTVYLLLHGHLMFYCMFPFDAIGALTAITSPVFYTVYSSALLLTYSLPMVTSVGFRDAHTNGKTASMRLSLEDCSQSRILIQSAAPVDWSIAGTSLQLHNVTQFAQFRVVVLCENKRTPVGSEVVFFDEFALRFQDTLKAFDRNHDHRIQVLAEPIPSENPLYSYQHRDRMVPGMWAILGARLATDYFRITAGKI
jgi:hypothetical protein